MKRIHGRKDLQSPLPNSRSPILLFLSKALFGYLLFPLASISILAAFFLLFPTPIKPLPKRALTPNPPLPPPQPPHRNTVIVKHQTDKCDLFRGHWVPDMEGRRYNSSSCRTIPDSKDCFKHGRVDSDFLNWRWKPDGCELRKFDGAEFLRVMKGKRLAFVGDSVARNHMESLLCLLSQVETPLDVYKDETDRYRTWNFPSTNFTLMVLWTKFLVKYDERLINGTNPSGIYNLHVDQPDPAWASKILGVDVVVISGVHWFFRNNYFYKRNTLIGCGVYCHEPPLRTIPIADALRMTYHTALAHIGSCKDCGDVVTVLRTFAPAHFEHGGWNSGGKCNRTSPYTPEQVAGGFWEEMGIRDAQVAEVKRAWRRGGSRRRFVALDVTGAMVMRPDGHPDSHWDDKWMKGYSDCVHWCMPGPVDVWNDLLMAVLLREIGVGS